MPASEDDFRRTLQGGQICRVGVEMRNADLKMLGEVFPAEICRSPQAQCHEDLISRLHWHLSAKGFTAAPDSEELIAITNEIQGGQSSGFKKIDTPLGAHSASVAHSQITLASIAQLRRLFSGKSVVLGLYKARFRQGVYSSAKIHKDDVVVSEEDVSIALFGSQLDPGHLDF